MSADLHLYAVPDTTETLAAIRAWQGSEDEFDGFDDANQADVFGERWDRPNVWVGQVSWAKAGILNEDGLQTFVASAIANVQRLVEDTPVITPGLITQVMVAMNVANNSIYGRVEWQHGFDPAIHWGGNGPVSTMGRHRIQRIRLGRGIARPRAVKRFLADHLGQRVVPASL
jgi:murein DD-endopeptidase MepM/ murein hydrolase activator NlpD